MSYNDLSGNTNKTHKRMSANWRHVAQTFQLEISDQAWPELSTSGTKKLNKKACVSETHSSKLYSVGSRDVLSVSQKSCLVDQVQRSNKYRTMQNSNDCQDTPDKHISSIDTLNFSMTVESCVEHTASKDRSTVAAEIVNSNFSVTQDKSDQVVSHIDCDKNGQTIAGKDFKVDSKQCVNKKTDTSVASFYENNFQNDFSLEFPTLDVNTKKANSKSKQLYKLGGKNCRSVKHNLDSNVKKPKAKDPICINILDVISTVTAKPKLIRGSKFETSLLSNPSVSVIKPLRKRVKSSAHIYGNPLDSDKPLHKKGKVRPNKKIKPSLLKAIILKTREDKLKAKDAAKKRLLDSKIILLNDVPHVNSVDSNDNSLTKMFVNGREKDNSGLHKVIHNDEKKTTPHLLHTRKFREYCNNYLTTGLIQSVSLLIETIVRYQDRQYIRDPIKAHAKRRYVVGLREAKKYVKMKRVRLLIIAPDLESVPGKGGLDDTIQQLKSEAEIQNIPYLFGPNRKQLGKSSQKNVLVSCVAVLNYDGAEDLVSKVLEYLLEARKKYSALTSASGYSNMALAENKTNIGKEENKSVNTEVIVSLLEKLTCCDSNIKQKNTKDMGKHTVSSPFLAALENIL